MDQELNAPLEAMAQRLRTESRADIRASADHLRTELRADLQASADQFRTELRADLQANADQLRTELRAEIHTSADHLRTELREDIQTSADHLRTELGADIQASATRLTEDAAERESRLRGEMRDGQRQLGVLIESLRGDIQVVAEGVLLLNGKFDRLALSEDRTRSRVDGLELRVLALEQAERERRRQS